MGTLDARPCDPYVPFAFSSIFSNSHCPLFKSTDSIICQFQFAFKFFQGNFSFQLLCFSTPKIYFWILLKFVIFPINLPYCLYVIFCTFPISFFHFISIFNSIAFQSLLVHLPSDLSQEEFDDFHFSFKETVFACLFAHLTIFF